jgi:hypothetical protein
LAVNTPYLIGKNRMSSKNILLLFLNLLMVTRCFGQDTVSQRNRLSDSVVEHFFVKKSKPAVREGPYLVTLKRRIPLVRGHYTNGIKTGIWQFFDVTGAQNEKYNYDTKQFTYEAPIYADADLNYSFDDSLKIGDKLTRPLKIGGIYFGFVPYLNIFRVPFDVSDMNSDTFVALIELLISPLGRLADYQVRLVSAYYNFDQIYSLDINLLSEEDRTFTPATLNGIPVISRILIKCYVSPRGELDFY